MGTSGAEEGERNSENEREKLRESMRKEQVIEGGKSWRGQRVNLRSLHFDSQVLMLRNNNIKTSRDLKEESFSLLRE